MADAAGGRWPAAHERLRGKARERLVARLQPVLDRLLQERRLDPALADELEPVQLPLAAWLDHCIETASGPPVIGLCGAQGSGKSTLAGVLARLLREGFGRDPVVLSLDDLYLGRAARRALAESVHPLLATRGVPGTHDTALARRVLDALTAGSAIALPAFDKGLDDRVPETRWQRRCRRADLVLFEGWCVGARPEPRDRLARPINRLERQEDPDGRWRRYVNDQLAGAYAGLFARLDRLILLGIPDWASVRRWRWEQEQRLPAPRRMNPESLERFLMHYERLTRWIREEMPGRADVVLELDRGHRVARVRVCA